MTSKNPAETVGVLVAELTPFESNDRMKIVQATLALLGEAAFKSGGGAAAGSQKSADPAIEGGGLPARAQTWLKQNNLSMEQIDQVFHIDGEAVDVIAAEIPGKTNRDKVRNAYTLAGIARLLAVGEAKFDDHAARSLCERSGFYDHTNHSKYLKGGNEFTGTKGGGWTLTSPGLKKGAGLIAEISKPG